MPNLKSLALVIFLAPSVCAHEGHRPLPARGLEVNVEAGSMVLTKAVRETLDVLTVEAVTQLLTRSTHAYGSTVTPWNNHAVIASPLTGRIVDLKVSPGESVRAGDRKSR